MDFIENCSDAHLKRLCNTLGVHVSKPFSRTCAIQIIQSLTTQHSRRSLKRNQDSYLTPFVLRLQKWWRKIQIFRKTANNVDFLTLEPIIVRPFYLVEETGHIYKFNPLSLATYFLKEGNFTNPYNRRLVNPIELGRLDVIVHHLNPHFVCLREEQKRITLQRSQEREHQQSCNFLHQECSQLIYRVLQIIKYPSRTPIERALVELEQQMLPQFFDTYRQLFLLDQQFACESITHIIQALHAAWNDATVAHTREGCYLIECVIATLSQFMVTIVPVLPAMLPELNQLQENRVR